MYPSEKDVFAKSEVIVATAEATAIAILLIKLLVICDEL